jgi:hypothetical protein
MKTILKYIIAGIIVLLIGGIGTWGVITNESDTSLGWKMFGWLLANIVIVFPCAAFWLNRVAKVLDL